MTDAEKREIALDFHSVGVVKFGEFRLKSGILSPIYVDLRSVFSSPVLLAKVARCLTAVINKMPANERHLICGVPYSAVPIATCVSTMASIPMLLCRKEAKSYGTKQMIEGSWKLGQHCVIVEDVVTSGSSVSTVAQILRNEGICVSRALILVDREQGGGKELSDKWKIKVDSLFKLSELAQILLAEGRITAEEKDRVLGFIRATPAPELPTPIFADPPPVSVGQIPLEQLIAKKSTRLCVAVDVSDPASLLRITEQAAPKICAVKLHLDMLKGDMEPQKVINGLRALAAKYGFWIMEDRKVADIGQTVLRQLTHGMFHIHDWCDLVTVHSLPGPGVFEAFRTINKDFADKKIEHRLRAVVVAQMSSADNLLSQDYTAKSLEMCRANSDVIGGFVCQSPLFASTEPFNPPVPYWVPGVNLATTKDQLGQQYNTPASVMQRFTTGTTPPNVILIVGRGITEAKDIAATAEEYRLASIKKA